MAKTENKSTRSNRNANKFRSIERKATMARLTKFFRVKMDPELRAKIQELAEREERSFAGQVRFIIKRMLVLHKDEEYAKAFWEFVEKKKEAEWTEQSKVKTKKGRILQWPIKPIKGQT